MESSVKMNPQPNNDLRCRCATPINRKSPGFGRGGGFTFVELLVAISVGAAVLAAAVLCFQAIGASRGRAGTYESVQVGSISIANFYYLNTNALTVWFAPNYGRMAQAEAIKDQFIKDSQRTMAVYCLPRVGPSSIRPSSISLSGTYAATNFDLRRLDTGEAFRQFLASTVTASGSVFTSNAFATEGAVRGQNLSVFMVSSGVSGNSAALFIDAVYELDFVRVTNSPSGTFASVRRYAGTNRVAPSDFYDIFYPDYWNGTDTTLVDNSRFYVAANFERSDRSTGTTVSSNRVAVNQPFYFVWWPDPASVTLPTGSSTNYKAMMRDQTSYLMVVPMFPAL